MRRLILRPGGIGDCLLAFPAMEHLRADYTEVWTRGDVCPLVAFADATRSITAIDALEIDPPAALIAHLKSFDECVSWYGAGRREFAAAWRRHGLPPLRLLSALPDGSSHACDFYCAQVGAPEGAAPRIAIPRWEGGFVAVHPFSGSPKKNWPLERFEELARQLPVERCESRFERLDDLARWLAGARLFVGNDSGITHLAAAVGTPVVALFGPTDPQVWAPRGARVMVIARASLEAISVSEVCGAAKISIAESNA
ncbi:MAG: glycosyltransferase family 9 protein [Bryobacter sp.]|nr:glycosyltransferase family 9 protein [Bryobacter sp.]